MQSERTRWNGAPARRVHVHPKLHRRHRRHHHHRRYSGTQLDTARGTGILMQMKKKKKKKEIRERERREPRERLGYSPIVATRRTRKNLSSLLQRICQRMENHRAVQLVLDTL